MTRAVVGDTWLQKVRQQGLNGLTCKGNLATLGIVAWEFATQKPDASKPCPA